VIDSRECPSTNDRTHDIKLVSFFYEMMACPVNNTSQHLLQPSWFEPTTWIFEGRVVELGIQWQGGAKKSPVAQSKRANKGLH